MTDLVQMAKIIKIAQADPTPEEFKIDIAPEVIAVRIPAKTSFASLLTQGYASVKNIIAPPANDMDYQALEGINSTPSNLR
jgi:hypothetical protein